MWPAGAKCLLESRSRRPQTLRGSAGRTRRLVDEVPIGIEAGRFARSEALLCALPEDADHEGELPPGWRRSPSSERVPLIGRVRAGVTETGKATRSSFCAAGDGESFQRRRRFAGAPFPARDEARKVKTGSDEPFGSRSRGATVGIPALSLLRRGLHRTHYRKAVDARADPRRSASRPVWPGHGDTAPRPGSHQS